MMIVKNEDEMINEEMVRKFYRVIQPLEIDYIGQRANIKVNSEEEFVKNIKEHNGKYDLYTAFRKFNGKRNMNNVVEIDKFYIDIDNDKDGKKLEKVETFLRKQETKILSKVWSGGGWQILIQVQKTTVNDENRKGIIKLNRDFIDWLIDNKLEVDLRPKDLGRVLRIWGTKNVKRDVYCELKELNEISEEELAHNTKVIGSIKRKEVKYDNASQNDGILNPIIEWMWTNPKDTQDTGFNDACGKNAVFYYCSNLGEEKGLEKAREFYRRNGHNSAEADGWKNRWKNDNFTFNDIEVESWFIDNFKEIYESDKFNEYSSKLNILPKIIQPQQGRVITSEFIHKLIPLIRPTDTFSRTGDDSIVETHHGKLKTVKPARLVSLIEEVCIPGVEVWNKKKKRFEKKSVTEQVCKIILESKNLKDSLRKIEKTLNAPIPILREEKLYFPKSGYNEDLKLYLNPEAPEITNPEMSLKEAKNILFEVLKEFCFRKDSDAVKAVLGLLTPFCRGLYKQWNTRTPIRIYFANRERAGKDYLAGIIMIIYEGQAIEEPPICTGKSDTSSNEELRKKILSSIMAGKQLLHFANNKGFINNSVLEQVSTASTWSDRILGGNKIATFDNTLEISLSGNIGTTLTSDLKNRAVVTNLHLAIENANDRRFKRPSLHHWVKDNRSLILSALYSLVRNWYDKGMPEGKKLFASFPEWASICGGILECAGFDNPLEERDEDNIGIDIEQEEMKKLYEYVYEKRGEEWIRKNQIKNLIREEELEELDRIDIFSYLNFQERSDQIKFALLIQKYIGRELSDITLRIDETVKAKHSQKLMFTKKKQKQDLKLDQVFNVFNEKDNDLRKW